MKNENIYKLEMIKQYKLDNKIAYKEKHRYDELYDKAMNTLTKKEKKEFEHLEFNRIHLINQLDMFSVGFERGYENAVSIRKENKKNI